VPVAAQEKHIRGNQAPDAGAFIEKRTGLPFRGYESYSAIYLDKVEPGFRTDEKSWIGKKLELHITALGKALLAWKPREEMDYFLDALILKKHTNNTFTDKKLFREELQKTRLRGWAIDNEESTNGAVCLSMPVFDMYHRVNYAISLSGDPIVYSERRSMAISNCSGNAPIRSRMVWVIETKMNI
jgi:DNA-binding IclR family transcriptional regulator